MKETVMAIALFGCISMSAHAGYEDEIRKQQVCKLMSSQATLQYDAKQRGEPPLDTSNCAHLLCDVAKDSDEYAYNKATSREDAHMIAWGKCMDGMQRIMR